MNADHPLLTEWAAACERSNRLPVIERYLPDARCQRLFACACCRRIWHLLTDEHSRQAVETAERFADGQATGEELREAEEMAAASSWAAAASARASRWAAAAASAASAAVRDRPAEIAAQGRILLAMSGAGLEWHPAWSTPTVRAVAADLYDSRRWEDVPILADALEDAGADAGVVSECRTRTEWYRGDWIIDRARGQA